MKLKVLDPNIASDKGHWMEVHADGCADLSKRRRCGARASANAFTVEAETLEAAAADIASDFIDEGSMTLESALQNIHFAPCVTLPRASAPPTSPPTTTTTTTDWRPHTLKGAQVWLRQRGIALRKRDGEYRVNLHGGEEATASYTTDLQDAIDTGLAMARERRRSAATSPAAPSEERALFLEDVIVTALEGGIGYWAELLSYEKHPHDHPNKDRRGGYKTAQLRDLEGGIHTLDVSVIERGIARIGAPGFKLNRALRGQLLVAAAESDAGDIDATGADVLVQAGLLGELVYG